MLTPRAGSTDSPLADLVRVSAQVADTAARLAKVGQLAELLRSLAPDEVEIAVSWLTGAPRQGRIGVGGAQLRSLDVVPAAESVLSIREVDACLDRIAQATGRGSAAARARLLGELFARATHDEQRFLVRVLVGELRQGALEGVLTDAIARAASVPIDAVRRAAMLSGRLSEVARAALERGAAGLTAFRLALFRPIAPMLAQTADDADDALARLGRAAFEWKLDGARIQVHRDGDEVRVYSRPGNDVTAAVPEIVEAVRALPARALLLDGEAIALRRDGAPEAFQTTMRRFGRRLDVERMQSELPLSAFFFDCLHVDGEDLLDRRGDERCAALGERVGETLRVQRVVVSDATAAHAFLDAALARGHEGVVAKSLEAPYEAGRRGAGWLKIKRAKTLDLVVLAVEWGSGRRKGWLSNLHLGARDPANGGFVMLGKTFKGMTDAMLEWQTRRFQELEIARDEWTVHVRPEQVVEVAFDGVQASPHYPGGVALRFARVKRYRDDKRAEDADTIDTVRALWTGAAATT